MKAVMKVAPGVGNVETRDIQEPSPAAGQVKIAVKAAGICGTDIHIYYDEYRTNPPVVMGHEVAGVVAELGEGVDGVQVGDRVTSETYFSTCGQCQFCRNGKPNLCAQRRSIGSHVDGAFAEYLVVPAKNVHRLPDNVDFLAGALTEPLACVVHGVLDIHRAMPGGLVVVAGPGAIGLLTLQVLRAAGMRVIALGTDVDGQRLRLAKQLGAEYTLNVQREKPLDLVMELTGGYGAEMVCECSGAGPAAQQLLTLVRKGGHYAQVGLFGKPVAWDLDQLCYRELTASGSFATVPSSWTRALRLMAEGSVQTKPLVSEQLSLTEWSRALDLFESKSGLKLLFRTAE